MHFDPKEVFFGGGVWMADPDGLQKIRQAIADDPKSWKKVLEDKAFSRVFPGVEGEGLARPPRGFDPAHPFINDIKRKSFFAMKPSTPKVAQSPALLDEVEDALRAAKPLMKFLCEALDAPF